MAFESPFSREIINTSLKSVFRYIFVFFIYILAFLIEVAIVPGDGGMAFLPFYPAMAFTALVSGVGPTVLVIILGGFTGYYFFFDPFLEFKFDVNAAISLFFYLLSGSIVCLLVLNKRTLEKSRSLLASIINSSNDAIACKGLDGVIISWNPGAERLFGYSAREAIGKPMTIIFPPDRHGEEADLLHRVSCGEVITRYETVRVRKDGTMINVSVNLSPVLDRFGKIVGAAKIAHDITDRKKYEKALTRAAQYDALTGLPNRSLFYDYILKSLSRAERSNKTVSLFFLDVDGFKAVNDTHGHRAGDHLLQLVAQRLVSAVRSGDLVSRIGGDEFTIIIEDCQPSQLATVAEKIIHELQLPFDIESNIVLVSISIGISIFPICCDDADDLINTADSAMYHAKKCGKGCFKFYS